MSWDGNLRRQIEADFRDVQRRRHGEPDTSDERPAVVLTAPIAETAHVVEKPETRRPRRIATRRTA